MNSKRWRERATYTAMSLFAAWHTLAIVVAPAPDGSVLVQSFRSLLHPYLTLFHLDNKWDFFAPGVDRGKQFRYVIEDSAGARHSFLPADELSWFHPGYWWFRSWYEAIMTSPDIYGESTAAWLCRKHAPLHPVSITLVGIEAQDFLREDYLNGKRPMDAEFVTVNTLTSAKCPR